MSDIEKVINGLEECTGNGNCTKCQYGKEKQALSCKKLLTDALAMLKEREAIEPRNTYSTTPSGKVIPHSFCGKCNKEIYAIYAFCPFCGQAVKWK